jgi:hypothetical protein
MRRVISEPQDSARNSPAETVRATVQEKANAFERPPTPGELYFETGMVLVLALGAAVLGEFIVAIARGPFMFP